MWTIIFSAIVGGFFAWLMSGTKKMAKIRRLKHELMAKTCQSNACGQTIVELRQKMSVQNDKTRDLRRDLAMWECMANEIVKHPAFDDQISFKTVPETGIQLLKFYKKTIDHQKSELKIARILIEQKFSPDYYLNDDLEKWKINAGNFLELTETKQ